MLYRNAWDLDYIKISDVKILKEYLVFELK